MASIRLCFLVEIVLSVNLQIFMKLRVRFSSADTLSELNTINEQRFYCMAAIISQMMQLEVNNETENTKRKSKQTNDFD